MKTIGIGIVEHEDSFLIGIRPEGVPLAGYAEFPGGKQQPGESTDQTAVRECREETGLEVVPVSLLLQQAFTYEHGELLLDFWHCRLGDPAKCDAIEFPWRWVQRLGLSDLTFPPANEELLKILLTNSSCPENGFPGN